MSARPLLLLLAPLPILAACKPDCAPNEVSNKHGYNCTPVPGLETNTSEATTSETSSTTTEDSSTAESSSTTDTPPPCDDDPACGPGETVQTCPAQCGDCGDGQRTGDELCDNGDDNQTYWPNTQPDGACSETCTFQFEWCGDAKQNGNEPCDNGTNADPVYSPTTPPDGACAPSCTTVAYCGDAVKNGNEPCDSAAQSATCELNCTTPQCGDGTPNPAAGEACDDNNTDNGDGCSGDCKSLERLVFVTSALFEGDLSKDTDNPQTLTGLLLADYRCQILATKAALPGTYKAWLSTDTESPSTRFDTAFTGLYRLTTTGFPTIAEGWTALTSSTLTHPINADETGASVEQTVFTNTLPNGTPTSNLDCSEWTSKVVNMNNTTSVGNSSASDNTWSDLAPNQFCSSPLRLYCFEDL